MRIAIVDDLDTERTLLKERLARQLRQRGTEADLLEFDSGEAFLAAEEAQRFTAAFLDIYMDGLSGMDAAKELRKTDADCLLVFTTTSTDHALEGFQVRAFHYLVKPFSEAELSGLLDEMLAKLPRPEPVLTVKVDGSDIRLRYRDIISAEHFAHMINIRTMVEDDNFAQTWYVFWVLPMVFILLNLFITPRYQITLQTGRVLQVYIVMSIALLFLMFMFNAIFLLMANSLNRNARLQQENQFLSMQQQRYESLKTAIDEARQARHDMRHQLNQISALAEAGDLDNLKAYLAKTVSRIPDLDMNFCENRAADSVVGYYCALAKREGVPFCAKLDLPQVLPVDEIDLCLVLSNLLENAFEASLRTAPARRKIAITAYVHAERLLLVEVENVFDGEVNEKSGLFRSSKRRENGIGIQSVRHIAEKTGGASTFTHQNGVFSAKVMLCG